MQAQGLGWAEGYRACRNMRTELTEWCLSASPITEVAGLNSGCAGLWTRPLTADGKRLEDRYWLRSSLDR
jgi:hypothetical protein